MFSLKYFLKDSARQAQIIPVLWIRIRMDPAKKKEYINKTLNSGLFVLLDSSTVLNREWQIVVRILLFD